jgi:hypothetical protein
MSWLRNEVLLSVGLLYCTTVEMADSEISKLGIAKEFWCRYSTSISIAQALNGKPTMADMQDGVASAWV